MNTEMKVKRGIVSVNASSDPEVKRLIEDTGKEFTKFKARYDEKVNRLEEAVDEVNTKSAAFLMNGVGTTQSQSVGTLLKQTIKDDSAFAHLANWNQGASARLDLPSASIQGSLVNEPNKGTSENTIPGRVERGSILAQPGRRLGLLEVLPVRKVEGLVVESIRLAPKGSAGIQAVEGELKANVAISGALQKTHLVTIAAWTSASRQALADHDQLSGLVDTVLRDLLRSKLEEQLVNGTGNSTESSEIAGLLTNGTQATGLESTDYADQLGEVVNTMLSDGYNPSFILVNPLDWFESIQVKRSLPDGQYLFGSPTSPVQPSIWNLPVVFSTAAARGAAAVIDTNFVTMLDRQSISVMTSNSHDDYFARNLIAILCEMRAGLEILDAGAIRTLPATSGEG